MTSTASGDDPFEAWHRACDERDPAFDGAFFVAITSTRIYCRNVCPSRRARRDRRRFFMSGTGAEEQGFRACKRCRPELTRGHAPVDAVARLARTAAERIVAGALDGRSVRHLAEELGVGDRQLRRAMARALGVSPSALAQTSRLRRARHLVAETDASITEIAYSSGFQSLRRFNAAFRSEYREAPREMRRRVRMSGDRETRDVRPGIQRSDAA